MKENKPICFVIMGFGKKQDPYTNQTINLDIAYQKIILPAVKASGYKCIRADEILDSGIIDSSMYALLYRADLVIADITTDNPNAIYELGIRHTLKPYSTIIMRSGENKLPFDINHSRIMSYQHLGNEISEKEAKESVKQLKKLIKAITENPATDSPLYTYASYIQQPIVSEAELEKIIEGLSSKENTIYTLTQKAEEYKRNSQFREAAKIWGMLSEKVENDTFYRQQQALCTYKSKYPSEQTALTEALTILSPIKDLTDTETLGMLGSIYKRLWGISADRNYLDKAIEMYRKGWELHQDYYTGENYAFCLEQKSTIESDDRRKISLQVPAEDLRKNVINTILPTLEEEEPEELKWKYATLASCYLALGEIEENQKYQELFMEQSPDSWEIDTYNESRDITQEYINKK